jgi:hypothetical protein
VLPDQQFAPVRAGLVDIIGTACHVIEGRA